MTTWPASPALPRTLARTRGSDRESNQVVMAARIKRGEDQVVVPTAVLERASNRRSCAVRGRRHGWIEGSGVGDAGVGSSLREWRRW
jgi:hypothetical protein